MGTLYIVATPIGNLEDITIRAIKTLLTVDYIACEDTRRTGQLLAVLRKKYTSLLYSNVAKKENPHLISYYDQVEEQKTYEIVELLESGKNVALVSDAGTPLISDPGFKLVRECIKRSVQIISIPGPTSLITALTVSGLPPNQFLFLGYPPEKNNQGLKLFNELLSCSATLKQIKPTYILYCSPHKITQTLTDMKEVFGDIELVVARELTKIHEEIWRGKISSTLSHFNQIKGEIVLMFNIPPE